MTRRETALKLVELGFQHIAYRYNSIKNHRFVLYRDGKVSGGGQAFFATYNENLLPDLRDVVTTLAAVRFLFSLEDNNQAPDDLEELQSVLRNCTFGSLDSISTGGLAASTSIKL